MTHCFECLGQRSGSVRNVFFDGRTERGITHHISAFSGTKCASVGAYRFSRRARQLQGVGREGQFTATSPEGLVAVILGGTTMPSTAKRPERLAMPGFDWRLSDAEVAALATFVRTSWSNDAAEVSAAQVSAVRRSR